MFVIFMIIKSFEILCDSSAVVRVGSGPLRQASAKISRRSVFCQHVIRLGRKETCLTQAKCNVLIRLGCCDEREKGLDIETHCGLFKEP